MLYDVFPTPVGVFPREAKKWTSHASLPHARGGVSVCKPCRRKTTESSPRPWGCFSWARKRRTTVDVFPTPVGVFPHNSFGYLHFTSLPHARGGVSKVLYKFRKRVESSPRPWGCFPANA